MEYTQEDWIRRRHETIAEGKMVIIAELCRDCNGRVPVVEAPGMGFPGVRDCSCGHLTTTEALFLAHGRDPDTVFLYPPNFIKPD